MTRKEFKNSTAYILTKEQCELWFKEFGKESNIYARNKWEYWKGKIGSTSLCLINSDTGKEKPIENHPSWRPLAYYNYSIRGWSMGDFVEVSGYCQSWDEIIETASSTEDMIFRIQKHPHQ
jgi:hypothetical protein